MEMMMKRSTRFLVLFAASISIASMQATAEVITFDEILPADSNCCYLTTEYADMGVTFVTTDDGSIWGGMSNGNPGSWYIDGTNGPAFLGFNGDSFSAQMLFDAPVIDFSLDMGPSIGWESPDDVFTLEGYLGGVLVDRVSGPPMGFGEWMAVALTGEVDEVLMFASGPSYPNAYGIDNVQWMPGSTPPEVPEVPDLPVEPEVMAVEIDIKPWRSRNFVNPFSRWSTRVAILGSESFDVESMDMETLEMGPSSASSKAFRPRDVNGDGMVDLVVAFRTRDLGIALGDTEACLSGETLDGRLFEGCDVIETWSLSKYRDRMDADGNDVKKKDLHRKKWSHLEKARKRAMKR